MKWETEHETEKYFPGLESVSRLMVDDGSRCRYGHMFSLFVYTASMENSIYSFPKQKTSRNIQRGRISNVFLMGLGCLCMSIRTAYMVRLHMFDSIGIFATTDN